jgi:preprotein translocase subunit SecA
MTSESFEEEEKTGFDAEKITVGMMDVVPFDEESREKVKKEIEKESDENKLKEFLNKVLIDVHSSREDQFTPEVMRQIEKYAYLNAIDHLWIDHIDRIDGLREGVRLRAYGQQDPIVEFKNEAYDTFETLIDRIDEELAHRIFRIGVARPASEIPLAQARTNVDRVDAMGLAKGDADATAKQGEKAFAGSQDTTSPENPPARKEKIGRNDPCWCGSGKKWKRCHYPNEG